MAKNEPDKFQKAAINIDINSVVSAGAGSGKTSVLSERFCHLVMEKGYKVEEILTLTFTREATVEMSSRIYKALRAHNSPEAANFYKANIKTIDSYCSAVAKTGAHLYGISPDFAQCDELYEAVKQMSLPFLLEHRDNLAIKTFVNTKDYEKKAEEIFVTPIIENSTVSEPVDFRKSLDYQIETIIRDWNKYSAEAEKAIETLSSAFHSFEGNKDTKTYKDLEKNFRELEMPGKHPLIREEVLNADTGYQDTFISYLEQFCIKLPTGKNTEEIKECIKTIKDLFTCLDSIRNFSLAMPLTLELIPLMEEFQEKVNNFKRTTGMLSFKDIASLAMCILRDHPELRQVEKSKYKAIMIDEFQDNNSQQRDLLFMLAEKEDRMEKGIPPVECLCPDKLFFVGDEKQSIYRFRGADVSVFRRLSRDFKDGNLSMTTNYRSKPALIACFNTIFGGYMYPPEKNNQIVHTSVFFNEKMEKSINKCGNTIPDYEAVYHEVTMPEAMENELQKMPDSEKVEVYKPHIHFALYDKNQEAEADYLTGVDAEAKWVSEKISYLISEENYKPEEIAIISRDYKNQSRYERALLNRGIPYNTATVTGFFADGPVNDIISALRLCIYPNDTLSYAQVLRSPLLNLSIPESEVILNQNAPLFEADISFLSEKSRERFEKIKTAFPELKKLAAEGSFTKAVTYLWYNLGYRYETIWNKTVELYGKMYDLIFELCRQSEQKNMTLSEFLDGLRTYQDQSKRLENLNIPLEQVPGVHLMTIHKSKGLEFKVVFVCDTQKKTGNDSNNEAIYSSPEYGITLNSTSGKNYFYELVKKENDSMQAAELRRLAYVALTRAKEQLFITNAEYIPDPDAESKYAPGGANCPKTVWNILEPFYNHYLTDEYVNKIQKPFDIESIGPQPRETHVESQFRRNTQEEKILLLKELEKENPYNTSEKICLEEVESKYILPSKLHKADEETGIKKEGLSNYPYPEITEIVECSSGKFGYNDFGTIAHSFMEAFINGTEPVIPEQNISGLEDNKKAIDEIKKICTRMKEDFASCKIGQEAKNSKWHKAEYEFKSSLGKKIVKGVIDLIFTDNDNNCTIVDYKTNQEIEPDLYVEQLAVYRQAAADMLNIENPKKIRCVLYYLRYGKEIDISEKCSKTELLEL